MFETALLLGIGIIFVIILVRKFTPKLPASLIGMIIATAIVDIR